MDEAIDAYESYLWKVKGNKKRSAITTAARLRSFFPNTDESLSHQTAKKCAAYYEQLTKKVTRFDKPLAVDTHRNVLSEAKTFLGWCVKKWLRANPLHEVKGHGKRKHGKPQLRIDEARKWLDKGLELAEEAMQSTKKRRQLEGVTAALSTLLLGTRSLETTTRVVRDLDDHGRAALDRRHQDQGGQADLAGAPGATAVPAPVGRGEAAERSPVRKSRTSFPSAMGTAALPPRRRPGGGGPRDARPRRHPLDHRRLQRPGSRRQAGSRGGDDDVDQLRRSAGGRHRAAAPHVEGSSRREGHVAWDRNEFESVPRRFWPLKAEEPFRISAKRLFILWS